jgi:hypothetical protein
MTVLLVDDGTGEVLGQFEDWQAALQTINEIAKEMPELADDVSLVAAAASEGAILASTSMVTVRSLT